MKYFALNSVFLHVSSLSEIYYIRREIHKLFKRKWEMTRINIKT